MGIIKFINTLTGEIESIDLIDLDEIVDWKELSRLTEVFSLPLDLNSCLARGLLEPCGTGYLTSNFKNLPEHIRRRSYSCETRSGGKLFIRINKKVPSQDTLNDRANFRRSVLIAEKKLAINGS